MDDDVDERLLAVLGDVPPPGIAALDATSRTQLAELVEDTRRRQAASLEKAFTASLKHVPFPLRGLVRRVLVG